jgi:hypothetical protein
MGIGMIAGALLSGLKGPQSGAAATSSSQSGALSFASQLQVAMQHSTQSSMQLGQPTKASAVHHQHGSLQKLLSSFSSATNGMSTGSLLASANSIAASTTNAAKSIFG